MFGSEVGLPRCDIHLLGSRSGYTTIAASAGVSADERRELEQLHFGEVGTRSAAERLRSEPAMAGFPLRSGRFAISRMLPSDALDDAGRPTVEVVTIVLEAAGYVRVAGVLSRLAAEIDWWDRARAGVDAGVEIPEGSASASPRDAAMRSMLDLWLAVRATRGAAAGVLPASDARRLLEFVAVLDPADRCALRWGIGLRTVSGRVDLCALAPEGSAVGMRTTIRPAPASVPHRARELEYVAVRATAGGATFVAVAEIDAMAGEVGAAAAEPRAVAARPARASGWPMSNARLVAIGSSVLSTCVLIVAVLIQQSRPPIARPSGTGHSQSASVTEGEKSESVPSGGANTTASGFGAVREEPPAPPVPPAPIESEPSSEPKAETSGAIDSNAKSPGPEAAPSGVVPSSTSGDTGSASKEAAEESGEPAIGTSVTTPADKVEVPPSLGELRRLLTALVEEYPRIDDDRHWSEGAATDALEFVRDQIDARARHDFARQGPVYAGRGRLF